MAAAVPAARSFSLQVKLRWAWHGYNKSIKLAPRFGATAPSQPHLGRLCSRLTWAGFPEGARRGIPPLL